LWNGFIEFYYQNYLVFTITGWLGIKDLRFGPDHTISEKISSTMAFSLVVYSVAFPIIIIGIYCLHYNKLSSRQTSDRKDQELG